MFSLLHSGKRERKLRESRRLTFRNYNMNRHCEGRTPEPKGFLFSIAMELVGPNKSYHMRAILLKSLSRGNFPQGLGLKQIHLNSNAGS